MLRIPTSIDYSFSYSLHLYKRSFAFYDIFCTNNEIPKKSYTMIVIRKLIIVIVNSESIRRERKIIEN